MFALNFAVVVLFVFVKESFERNVPGSGDPDTFTGNTIHCEISPGVIIEESIVGAPENVHAGKSDVNIFFHCNSQPPPGIELNMFDASGSLRKTHFNSSKTTFFVIHGWRNDYTSNIFIIIKEALIPSKDVNLFIVDWGKIAQKNYITARYNVEDVGKCVGDFIKDVVEGNNLNLDNTHIVGHSLGAHIAGIVGARLNAKVNTIVGLDPAWPLFYFSKTRKRLNDKDAKFVQVIHTNGGLLGFPYSIGTADYYPNGGFTQAGCFLDVTGTCAHGRSYQYYGESLKSGNFVSRKCDSYKLFKRGYCNYKRKSDMGRLTPDSRAVGDYYLNTNNQAPFAMGG